MDSINPANDELIASYESYDMHHIGSVIEKAEQSFRSWRNSPFADRVALVAEIGKTLSHHVEEFAHLITQEMGKVLKDSVAEIEKCITLCEYYAQNAESFLQDQAIQTDSIKSFVTYQPIGVILAIMPWNYPFWQVLRFAIPTILAGNVCLLRHALNVSGCALTIEKLFSEANTSHCCLQTLLAPHDVVARIIEHPSVQGVAFTGSTHAGRIIAKNAGKALKKVVLELGGSDPYIILSDANLAQAANICVKSRLTNTGQSCIAAKRFLVMESVYDEFLDHFITQMHAYNMGDPLHRASDLGPLASKQHRTNLHKQVLNSIAQGATCKFGGKLLESMGAYYPPTILTNVKPGMTCFDEELFGPVASISRVSSENEAIEWANKSAFGLGSAIFTCDLQKAEHIAKYQIDSGMCFINKMVVSDPRLPFGGIKHSGYGRELGGLGIKEFSNAKTIVISS